MRLPASALALLALAAGLAAAPVAAQDLPFPHVRAFLDSLDTLGAIADEAEREAAFDALWDDLRAAEQIPFALGDSAVVLYRGSYSSPAAVAGDHNGWNPGAGSMSRVGLSRVWHRVYAFPPAARIDYKLVVGGSWILDPENPHQQWSGFGPNSELRMPAWVFPEETVRDPDAPRGAFTSNQVIESTRLGYPVHYRVYTPAGYDDLSDLPVLYVTDGHEYSDDRLGAALIVLDNLIHDGRAAPALAVFVDPREVGNPSNNRRAEQYVQNPDFAAFLAEELVPAIDAAYRTRTDRDGRVILGTSLGGVFSTYLGLQHPDVFGRLAIQSPAFWVSEDPDWWTGPSLFELVDAAPEGLFTIYMSTGTINDGEGNARRMRDLFEAHDHDLTYHEVPEGHSWGNWRALIDEVLMALLPGTAVSTEPVPESDTGLRLDSFPNPAVGGTTLRFRLPAPSAVSLSCYDARGRRTAALADGVPLPAGQHQRALPAGALAAGRYHCRLDTATGSVTHTLTLTAR